MWHERNVLVTGCSGFLGSWLTEALVENGASVAGLVRDQVSESMLFRSGTADRINVVHGNLCDLALLQRTLGEYEIETVFHLGAQAIVGEAHNNPLGTFESNVRGTWTLLEACRAAAVPAGEEAIAEKQRRLKPAEQTHGAGPGKRHALDHHRGRHAAGREQRAVRAVRRARPIPLDPERYVTHRELPFSHGCTDTLGQAQGESQTRDAD